MRRYLLLLTTLLALGCGEQHVESPAELTPDPTMETDDTPPPEANAETEPTEPEEVVRSGRVEVVDLPDEVPALPTLDTSIERTEEVDESWGEPGSYSQVTIPGDEATATRINAFLAQRATRDPEYPSNCRAVFSHPKVLSLRCEDMEMYERGGSEMYVSFENVKVTDDAVEAFTLAHAISPTANFDALIRTGCAGMLRREEGLEPEEAEEQCRDGVYGENLRISPRGIVAWTDYEATNTFTVPWSALDRAVYADTPLGQALAALEGSEIVEIELPPGTVRAGQTASGTTFGDADRARVALGRWMQLSPEHREGLVIAGQRADYQLALPSEVDVEVGPLAQALGASSAEGTWGRAAIPHTVRTRVETSFRSSPGGDRTLILPAGTVLAVALGRLDGRESAMGRRGTWALTAAAPGVAGYTAGALLEEHEGCEPAAAPFIDGLPEGFRETATRSLVRALVQVRRAGRDRPAIAYGGAGRSNNPRRLGASRVEVYERDEDCAVGSRLARLDLEGNLFAMRFTTTTAHGGSTLLLVGSYLDPRRLRWQLFELGETEALWTHEAPLTVDVLTQETVDGEYYPVVVESSQPIRVAWVDGAVEVQ